MAKSKSKAIKSEPGAGRTTPPGQPPNMRMADPSKMAQWYRGETMRLTDEVAMLQACLMEDQEIITNLRAQLDKFVSSNKGEADARKEVGSQGSEPEADSPGGPSGAQGGEGSSRGGQSNGRRAASGKRS